MLAANSGRQTVFRGDPTANCCITVDFAASKPGVPAGPIRWMTTRYAPVFVQMWVMRSAIGSRTDALAMLPLVGAAVVDEAV